MSTETGSSVFEAKLDALPATINLCTEVTVGPIRQALDIGRTWRIVAVGSGGSLAAAHYLAACRRDVSERPVSVQTPMEFVLGLDDLSDAQVWLFTGRGQNPDIAAALRAADTRGAADIRILTANQATPLASYSPRYRSAHVHTVPVADEKDGFLSTHTLAAFVVHLLLATDGLVDAPREVAAGTSLKSLLTDRLSPARREQARSDWRHLADTDTVIALTDPTLVSAAVGLETSLWETAIAPVQRTDLRNFAHGRHIWPARRANQTVFVVLTAQFSRTIWNEIAAQLPVGLRQHVLDYGAGGRLQAAQALLDSLVMVAAMGTAVSIDPGRPGAAAFARPIYEADALDEVSRELSPPVRHKFAAALRIDGPEQDVVGNYDAFLSRLAAERFKGLVLDYDGTVVATQSRYHPPDGRLLDQIRRLLNEGLRLAIATGRGGSAGDALREALEPDQQVSVIMGYYNGGYVQPLSLNIDDYPAPEHPAIVAARAALAQIALRHRVEPRVKGCQVSFEFDDGEVPGLVADLLALPGHQAGALKLVRSQHSIDIVPVETSKLNVVARLTEAFGLEDDAVLCVGDSGHAIGNDHDLLGHPSGLSVDKVCARPGVCWAPFGSNFRGPEALFRILNGLVKDSDQGFRIDLEAITATVREQRNRDDGIESHRYRRLGLHGPRSHL